MITKILLVAILVILSWQSFKLSEKNQYLETQLQILSKSSNTTLDSVIQNKKYLNRIQSILGELTNLDDNNQEFFTKLSSLEKDVKLLPQIVEKLKNTDSSIKKQNVLAKENQKLIKVIISKIKNCNKYTKPNKVSTKTVRKIKKSNLVSSLHEENNSLSRLYMIFYQVKNSYLNRDIPASNNHLDTLKTEAWKLKNNTNISKENILSILSSIDIVKAKWKNNDLNYNLNSLEEKLHRLHSSKGMCK